MVETGTCVRRWYFAFTDGEGRWWDRLCKPGFRHCFSFTELVPNIVMSIDPTVSHAEHELWNEPLHKIVADCKDRGYTLLMLPVHGRQGRMVRRGPLVTCASYLAYTAGVNFCGITPYSLYRAIIHQGGIRIE